MPSEASLEPSRPRQHRGKQRALQLIAAATIAIVSGLIFFELGETGSGTPEARDGDEDLKPVRRVVPEEQNGFSLLPLERGSVYRIGDADESSEIGRLSRGEGSNWELAADILARNSEILARFEESAARPELQFPVSGETNQLLSAILQWYEVSRLLALQAFLRAETDGVHAGVREALKLVRFGERVEAAQGSAVSWMMGTNIKRVGLDSLRVLSQRSGMRSQELVALCRQLEQYGANREGFAFGIKLGYQSNLEDLVKIANGEREPALFAFFGDRLPADGEFDLQSTRRQMADGVRSVIRLATEHELTWGLQLPPEAFASRPNNLGDAIYEWTVESWHSLLETGAQTDVAVVATRTLLALRAYHLDTGDLPRSLAELVPEYLPEIPIDAFDGKPIRYSLSERIVYSVGRDLLDRGGSDRNAIRAPYDADEPTFRIEF